MTAEQTATKPKKRGPAPRYTKAFTFTTSMLISTAKVDIMRRARNAEIRKRKVADPDNDEAYARFAFHPSDVRKATKASEVQSAAVRRAQGHKTAHRQKNRILIYGDVPLLKAALRWAEQQEAPDEPA